MRKLTAAVAVLLAATSISAISGNDSEIQFFSSGAGTHSCGDYLENRQSDKGSYKGPAAGHYYSWVLGYVSGMNTYSNKKLTDPLPLNSTIAYLDKYCQDHPLKPVINGASCLFLEHKVTLKGLECK